MKGHTLKAGFVAFLTAFLLLLTLASALAADEHIIEVTALGFVDLDGPKLQGVALRYDQEMTGAVLSPEMFSLSVYVPESLAYKGDGEIGDILRVYVSDVPAIDAGGGTGQGEYVILEVFTDYLTSSFVAYSHSMSVKVDQLTAIRTDLGEVPPTNKSRSNGFGKRNKALRFIIPEIAGFRYYTDDPGDYGAEGESYVREDCFSQQDGRLHEEHLAYALCLPEDYREDGRYALLTLQNPAATPGTHPMESVLASRSPAVYASDWAQELVRSTHGLDGLIVLVPVITERVNDNGGTPAEYEAVVHLWDEIIDRYHVDPDYVYGTGQSVGGMILLETNRNRDNFFAGLLLYEDQWAQNYYIDTTFARDMVTYPETAESAPMHYPRTDEYITWDYALDTQGNPVTDGHDPYNMYYLISDDEIMITHVEDNNLSHDTWMEMHTLYEDLTGTTFPQFLLDASQPIEDQNASLQAELEREQPMGIHWVTLQNGVSGFSSRELDSTYAWLLTRSRQMETAREKLDINKPFELADVQIQDDTRRIYFTEADGSPIYLYTAKRGAGTQLYNTSWLNLKKVADARPGWLPDGMSWTTGVTSGHVVSVVPVEPDAVAIRHDVDMEGTVIHLVGDPVINFVTGEAREDTIVLAPYDFYDADGNLLQMTIQNVYANDRPEKREGAERASGNGEYLIVEFAETPVSPVSGVVQRTTVRTDLAIITAIPWLIQ